MTQKPSKIVLNYRKEWKQIKKAYNMGQLTKREEAYLMLGLAQKTLLSLKVPEPEKENLYQARFYN